MDRWGDAAIWEDERLRREVFFFSSGGAELFGSLYAAASPSRRLGVVACPSWGFEADQTSRIVHGVVRSMAVAGGAGLVFHYPGFGDSGGDQASVTIDAMVRAAVDAVAEAQRRGPDVEWALAGYMLGASVAALAAVEVGVRRLALVQPALRPASYFERIARGRRDARRAQATDVDAYGYELAAPLLDSAAAADDRVARALADFEGEGAVVRYSMPAVVDPIPDRFERIDVSGTWRFASKDNPRLTGAIAGWLREQTRETAK